MGNKATTGVSVIIPCLNEEESIGQVVDAARIGISNLDLPGEVIVVDNGCTDNSPNIAREHGAIVLEEKTRGYGAAIRKGFDSAQYSVLVMGDGDLTYDFSKVDELVNPIIAAEYDFMVGNRMSNIKAGAMPFLHRYIGNPLLSLLLRIMFRGNIVKDAHCGLRAISRTEYRKLGCVTTGMEFASEMIVLAIYNNLRMSEKPIIYHARVGESKLVSFRDGWRHLRFMAMYSPSSALLIPGLIVWLLGFAIVLPLAFGPVMINDRAVDIHCMIMGGLLSVVSMQFITTGLLAKTFAHLTMVRHDKVVAWLYDNLTFEKMILGTLPLIIIGIVASLTVVMRWVSGGFGSLDEVRLLFFGMLALITGAQIATSGYLFSIMALPHHLGSFNNKSSE